MGGDKISVGPPFFNATFVPLMVPLLLAMPIGPMLAWKRGDLRGVLQRLWLAAASRHRRLPAAPGDGTDAAQALAGRSASASASG